MDTEQILNKLEVIGLCYARGLLFLQTDDLRASTYLKVGHAETKALMKRLREDAYDPKQNHNPPQPNVG